MKEWETAEWEKHKGDDADCQNPTPAFTFCPLHRDHMTMGEERKEERTCTAKHEITHAQPCSW